MDALGVRASLVRFGPFEADLEAEALRRDGHFVQIQQQPFQVLATLVEYPGQIVTRELLRQRLWPDGLHIDFEHSLNTAIKKVRVALDDSPDHPQYVETVRGRGYRSPGSRGDDRAPPCRRGQARCDPQASTASGSRSASPGWRPSSSLWPSRRSARGKKSERLPRVVPLTSYPGMEYQATFSPDGSHFAFVWSRDGNHDIYVQPVGVLKPLPLTEEPELEHSPDWSPDGRWIAFIRDPAEADGRARVLVKPPFAGQERVVTEYVGRQDPRIWQRQIAWTPDSRHLVLSRPDDDGATWSLYLVDATSGEMRRLAESPARDSAPAVSADGRSLAFSRRVVGKGRSTSYPSGGTSLRRIARGPWWGGSSAGCSRRRGLHAGVDARRPRGRVRRLPLASSSAPGERSRSPPAAADPGDGGPGARPGLCPRTGRLAYTNWEIVRSIMRLEISPGSDTPATPVSFNSTRSDGQPRFSPDGRTVAFTSTRLGRPAIWLSSPDGRVCGG